MEMIVLRGLDPSSKQAQKAFRLQVILFFAMTEAELSSSLVPTQVKERLYRFNYVSFDTRAKYYLVGA